MEFLSELSFHVQSSNKHPPPPPKLRLQPQSRWVQAQGCVCVCGFPSGTTHRRKTSFTSNGWPLPGRKRLWTGFHCTKRKYINGENPFLFRFRAGGLTTEWIHEQTYFSFPRSKRRCSTLVRSCDAETKFGKYVCIDSVWHGCETLSGPHRAAKRQE
jgi:hypothetical protein